MDTEKLYSLLEREIEAVLPEVTELRREIHRNPEIRFEEEGTAGRIREFLSFPGIDFNEPFIGTDVTGIVRGERTGAQGAPPAVVLRADMDALPLEDATEKEIRSRHPGRAHACGHDGHMAVLAGALKVLARLNVSQELPGGLRGKVGFVFQPGEEEGMGACKLLDAGLFERGLLAGITDTRSAAGGTDTLRGPVIAALHAWPGMPAGSFAARPGPYMAAADRFVLTVTGAGGHGAMPHRAVDPVIAAAELILALQTIVSRRIDPTDPAVVTIGSVHGGKADNVIPDRVELKGTIRSFSDGVQSAIREEIGTITEGICRSAGCTWAITYSDSYPVLSNDFAVVEAVKETVLDVFGADRWFTGDSKSMGAEDFACYLARMPGAMIRLGMGEDSPSLHAPDFEFKEEALSPAIAFLSAFSVKTLERL